MRERAEEMMRRTNCPLLHGHVPASLSVTGNHRM